MEPVKDCDICGMESSNVITAPQTRDAQSLFAVWNFSDPGSAVSFYRFLTAPSAARDAFVRDMSPSVEFCGDTASISICPADGMSRVG